MGVKRYDHDKFLGSWAWNSSNFWSKIIKGTEEECWTWLGSQTRYGPLFGASKMHKGVYRQQMTQARRILFAETQLRYLGDREGVYHTCHNKHCMNPHHLSLDLQRRPQHELKKPGPKPRPKPLKELKIKQPNLNNALIKQVISTTKVKEVIQIEAN